MCKGGSRIAGGGLARPSPCPLSGDGDTDQHKLVEKRVANATRKGSAGGHNGIKNIIQHLGHNVFQRIKVGVGEKPKEYDLADYVLGHFSKEDKELMKDGYKRAVEAVEMLVMGDIDGAMNEFNKKVVVKE